MELSLKETRNISFVKGQLDIVIALEIFEHIPSSSRFKVLGYQEGWFIEKLESLLNKGINLNRYVRIYTSDLLLFELEIGGFEVASCNFLYAFYNHYFVKNLVHKFLFRKRWSPH